MNRQTECRDYSDDRFPGMAVTRANNLYHCVHVAHRLSSRHVVIERFVDGFPPRAKLAAALDDLRVFMTHDGKYPEGQGARLSPFVLSFAWLLLAYGAVQEETALRLDIDPVCGPVGYVSQLAGEIRFIGNALLSSDPLAGEETLLDHLRGTTMLARLLPDPAWYCFERERGEAGGAHYRFFFDTGCNNAQDQRARLVGILTTLTAQALGYAPLALESSRSLFQRMWEMRWYTEDWQPIHVRTLFGAIPSVHYEHLLHECFERACAPLATEGGAGRSA